ncbi:signal peptidase II [Devosia sp.]|uniref:signal peptidase II n=1 Tax=Devosia sp. TaxID=1871048 RepID=UPI0025FD9D5B|nr:signal peptidase II [Devosia sp.]MCR6634980.1 signal peptidase II [Devosia sp.]
MSNRDASLFLVLGIIGVDASTKEAALMYLDGASVPVLPVLNLTLGFNTGVSFGMFAADGPGGWWTIVLVTLAVSAVVAWLWHRSHGRLERLGYAAILGGALGNLVDRVPDGAVTDFIDLHAGGWHFPTFNLADVGITAGVVMLLMATVTGAFAGRTEPGAGRP